MLNKIALLAELADVAQELDKMDRFADADQVLKIMKNIKRDMSSKKEAAVKAEKK